MDSIAYYDKNSEEFFLRTIHVDMNKIYEKFLNHIPEGVRILDAGCGVGRDAKFFVSKGYDVVPFDGSIEMVKLASDLLRSPVLHMRFQEMNFFNEFDAIWANASLLHVPYENLRKVIASFYTSLRPCGVLYASFKYGSSMQQVEDRQFFDMNEASLDPYLEGLFSPLEIWRSKDTRDKIASNQDEGWLSFIARRN